MLLVGCGTTTNRIATEQLLMSTAVDDAVAKIDFGHLADQKVYLDTTYLRPARSTGFINADYVTSALRQQLTAAGCLIQDKQEHADTVVEARVGALGTDGHEIVYGLPQTGGLSAAASAFTGSPLAAIPEVSVAQTNAQSGVAKVIVFAYDRQTRQPIWQSGVATAESNSSNTWILGAGPFQRGSIYDGNRFAGREIKPAQNFLPRTFARKQQTTAPEAGNIDFARLFGSPHNRHSASEPDADKQVSDEPQADVLPIPASEASTANDVQQAVFKSDK